jgi:16S rRNA (guanine(966)-N(2))-methyltransferase RsmD
LRIISGKYKGRRIPIPGNFKARPTTDFAKEALFNIIANYFDFETICVLDLFSGTGSIGYEFASRGADRVDMVEMNKKYSDFIRQTIQYLGLRQVKIFTRDVFRAIPRIKSKYDIIFADPPYDLGRISEIPGLIFEHGLLEKNAWLILEHGRDLDFSENVHFKELRKYGSVHFSIFTQ